MRPSKMVAWVLVLGLFALWWTVMVDHEPATFVNNLDDLSGSWGLQRPIDDGYAPLGARRSLTFVMEANRKALRKVETWLVDSVLAESFTGYGLWETDTRAAVDPALLDRSLGREPVFSDVATFLSLYLYDDPLSVLVLGDETGKSVFQLLNFHSAAFVTSIAIEDVNPTLERFLTARSPRSRSLPPPSLPFGYSSPRPQDVPSTLSKYVYTPKDNVLDYYAADVQDDVVWASLEGARFNLIISLGDLTPPLLRYMYSKIIRHNLLISNEFVILLDGLADPDLVPIFRDMVKDLQSTSATPVSSCIARMRGALLGKNGPYTSVGLITTLDLSEFRRRHIGEPL